MLSFLFAVVSFFSTRTTLMSQLPRLNLISFTGTLLEVMMICIVVLMFRKMFMKTVLQETWPLPLPSLFLRRTTGTYFTLRFDFSNCNNINITGTMEVLWRSLRSPLNFWRYLIAVHSIITSYMIYPFHNNIISSMHVFTIQLTKGWSTTQSRHYHFANEGCGQ